MGERVYDADSYRVAMMRAYRLLADLFALPLEEILESIEKANTLGPLLDPTLWIAKQPAMREDKEVVRALLKAKAALPAEMHNVFDALGKIALARMEVADYGLDRDRP